MIEKLEAYLKNKFGNVNIIKLAEEKDKHLYQFIVNFRDIVITFILNIETKVIQTKINHREEFTFKEFDDIILFRGSINIVIETLEDLVKITKEF